MKNNTKPSAIEENRQFSEMLKSAIEKLHKYTPEDITRRTNIEFDKEKSEFHFTSLGKEIIKLQIKYKNSKLLSQVKLGEFPLGRFTFSWVYKI